MSLIKEMHKMDTELKRRIINTISELERKTEHMDKEHVLLEECIMALMEIAKGFDLETDDKLDELRKNIQNKASLKQVQMDLLGLEVYLKDIKFKSIKQMRGVVENLATETFPALKIDFDTSRIFRNRQAPKVREFIDFLNRVFVTQAAENEIEAPLKDAMLQEQHSDTQTTPALIEDLKESLLHLIDSLVIPEPLTGDFAKLRQQIEDTTPSDDLAKGIDSLASLMIASFKLEQDQYKIFLTELTSQLSVFERYILDTTTGNDETQVESRNLESGIQESIASIRDSMDSSQSISEMRKHIGNELLAIGDKIKQFRENESLRMAAYEERIIAMQQEISRAQGKAEQLQSLIASHEVRVHQDSLTGLHNRSAYDEYIERMFSRWERGYDNVILVVGDIDHFKRINDDFGHVVGDKVLKKVAEIFKTSIRNVDFVARYGGEEFVFVFEHTKPEDAKKVVEQIRTAIESCPFYYREQRVPVTVSFGITEFRKGDNIEQAFVRADQAMYQAKKEGRNRSVYS